MKFMIVFDNFEGIFGQFFLIFVKFGDTIMMHLLG